MAREFRSAVDDTLLHRTVFFRPATAMGHERRIRGQRSGGKSTTDSGPRLRPGWLPARAKGLNRYRDSAHFEVGSQLIGQP